MSMQTPKEIGSIQSGLMDPETYRDTSVTRVIIADAYDDDGYPIDMGLMDPRLGAIDPGLQYRTCGQHSRSCNGHFGHIELATPIIHAGFTKLIRRLLRSMYRECGRLSLTDEGVDEYHDKLGRARELGDDWSDVMKSAVRQTCKANRCPHCGSSQYDIKHEKPMTYYKVQNVLTGDYSERIAEAMQLDPDDEDNGGVDSVTLANETGLDAERVNQVFAGEFRPAGDDRKVFEETPDLDFTEEGMSKLMSSDVRDWFEDVPDEDLVTFDIDPDRSHPERMILIVLPVPPVTARPFIAPDNGQRSGDDLTYKFVDITRISQWFMEDREAGASQLIIEDLRELLQYHVTTFIDNEISGTPPARRRSGRPLKTLSQHLKGKEGRFRGSLFGKHVSFSACTVISPDPMLSLNEVDVPDRVMSETTQTINVTERNVDEARQHVRNGPESHPGANYVHRPDGRRPKVTEKDCEGLVEKVELGWEVNHHLVDGDIVIFNRQPSSHRMPTMAHKVVVMPCKTFRLNTVVCPLYNADFDGDEMNMRTLQNEEARAEARVLMRVQEQILSPRFGENIIGAIQDHISGTYLLTHDNSEFVETQALGLLRTTRVGTLPEPAGENEGGQPYWTSQQIFSELLSDGPNMEFTSEVGDTVSTEDGQLMQGTIGEDAVGALGGEIADALAEDHSKTCSCTSINEIASLAMHAIMHFGLSIGIDDEPIPDEATTQVDEAIDATYDKVQEFIGIYEVSELELLPGRFVDETLEMKIIQRLGKARDSAGEIAEDHFEEDNPVVVMSKSGACASMLNLTQMAGCVGQQAVRGERINRGYEGRTLSHYQKGDLSAEVHGFVENSYHADLTLRELLLHAMGGREGLVDTAVRTSKSGYLQRRPINALPELEAQYDGSVRDTSGTIVQSEFDEDGTSPVKVSSDDETSIDVESIADRTLASELSSDEERERFLGKRASPTNLSEHAEPCVDARAGIEPDD